MENNENKNNIEIDDRMLEFLEGERRGEETPNETLCRILIGKRMIKQIKIDEQVRDVLEASRMCESETYNEILKRLLEQRKYAQADGFAENDQRAKAEMHASLHRCSEIEPPRHIQNRLNKMPPEGFTKRYGGEFVHLKYGTKMMAWFKGDRYEASVGNGCICYGGKEYKSLSGAAHAITKNTTSGWSFWRVFDERTGRWVNVRSI